MTMWPWFYVEKQQKESIQGGFLDFIGIVSSLVLMLPINYLPYVNKYIFFF